MKRLVAFMRTDCPICFRLKTYLSDLALSDGVPVELVYIDTVGNDSLCARYWFFCDTVFGGEEHVPVLLLGEERWYVPRRTTARSGGDKYSWKEIDEACRKTVEEVREHLKEKEEIFPETHGKMKGVKKWAPNTFLSRAQATT